ncbi:MAG: type VI secretion system contractile sheath large subunit [Rubrivivax sp.]
MPGRLEFTFSAAPDPARRREERGPTRLLVLGDFSAASARPRPPLEDRPTHRVDLDNLSEVLARLAPAVQAAGQNVDFESLEDFHPDSLHARLPLFQALREARTRGPASGSDLLGQLLGGSAAAAAPAAAGGAEGLDALIRRVVAPHIVPDTAAATRSYLAAVDAASTEQMRRLLHDRAFQALEAAWRGVAWLVASLELGEDLELHLFDVRREELLADVVAAQGQLARTGLHRALADRWRNVPGAHGWSLLAGLFRFGPTDADIGLLAALGILARQAGGPFVAEADPALAGPDEARLAGWRTLRTSEAAPWIGLAAPRLLLRQPYGRGRDPVDAFAFEEVDAVPEHESLLWGNPALAVALLCGRARSTGGTPHEIGDLPAVSFERDGERVLQPCAERLLGEQATDALLAAGLIPLASHKDRNAVTLMRLQSVADPARALAGWA